jgi:1,2-phenylacetyl-CoA epoxidase PaaB subunit
MTRITVKPAKENAKTRKYRRTGEFFATKDANRALARRIESAFTRLSEGCSVRVIKAINAPPLRPEPERPTMVFKTHTKVRNEHGQHVNARQKMRGKSIPLI